MNQPSFLILAGPNGAGKTTLAPKIVQEALGYREFVNADNIARGLSAFHPESAAFEAGRIVLKRLRQLANQRESFAFETTLATRSFAPWIEDLKKEGYLFFLYFLWLPSPELAVERVKERLALGGHFVPEEIVRRRYFRGIKNFFERYQKLADEWKCWNNSLTPPELIAEGQGSQELTWFHESWKQFLAQGRKT